MDAVQQFLAMGGYAGFVWPAWLVPVLVLAVLWIVSARAYRNSQDVADRLSEERRRLRRGGEWSEE